MRYRPVLLAVAVAGCASTHQAAKPPIVRFTNNRDVAKDCMPLGYVDSSDKTNGGTVGAMPPEDRADRRLRNEAAKLGANIVLLSETPTGLTKDPLQRGEAYKCPRE